MHTRNLYYRPIKWRGMILFCALLLGVASGLVPTQGVWAATITVTNTNDSGAGSLRQAINRATAGDIITFDPSLNGRVITLASSALTIQKKLSIRGPGADLLTISGNGKYRVFIVMPRGTVDISGLTIANGYARGTMGAGIFNSGNLTLDHVDIRANVLDSILTGGAGIYNNGTLKVTFSVIRDNRDKTYSLGGGGIYNNRDLVVEDSLITNNQVHSRVFIGVYGGGGIANRGTAVIQGSVISNNLASNYSYGGGGGIYNSGSLTLSDSQVAGNQASGNFGGGIINWLKGVLVVKNTTFSANQTNRGGGAIENLGMLTVSDSTIAGNSSTSSEYGGGGVETSEGAVTLTNTTLSGNTASAYGGGLANDGGSVTLAYVTLSNNAAITGGGIYSMGDAAATNTTLINSLVAYNAGEDCTVSSGVVNITNTWIADNTCAPTFFGDPLLGPLQNNGGPTETQLLLPGSPAIDQAVCSDNLVDQRGLPRPFDVPDIPDWPEGGGCDLGAIEFQESVPQE